MTALQYNLARAAYEAYHNLTRGVAAIKFDSAPHLEQLVWLGVAAAVVEKLDDAIAGKMV